jgi:hypothetical protein
LFGNRWQTNEKGETVGADLIHKYSPTGEYLASFQQFPEEAKSLDLYNYDFPATDIQEGDIFTVLPFDYTIYRLTEKDEFSVFLKGKKDDFIAPSVKLDASKTAPADAYKFVQSWRLKWTPIASLAVLGDDLFVQYQTFNPLRYTIDNWSISTKQLKTTIKTNYLLLNRGLDNNFYEIIRAEIK